MPDPAGFSWKEAVEVIEQKVPLGRYIVPIVGIVLIAVVMVWSVDYLLTKLVPAAGVVATYVRAMVEHKSLGAPPPGRSWVDGIVLVAISVLLGWLSGTVRQLAKSASGAHENVQKVHDALESAKDELEVLGGYLSENVHVRLLKAAEDIQRLDNQTVDLGSAKVVIAGLDARLRAIEPEPIFPAPEFGTLGDMVGLRGAASQLQSPASTQTKQRATKP